MTPAYFFRVTTEHSSAFIETLYCFFTDASPACDELSEALTGEITDNLAPDEIVFLCPQPAVTAVTKAWTTGAFSGLLSRVAADMPMSVAPFDAQGQRGPIVPMQGTPRTETKFSTLARQGVTKIFRDRGGFIEPNASYHFENPSGNHTNRFIRLSNLLSRQVEISFLAFSLLPSIPTETRLAYIDTPSLFAVVAAINELLRVLTPKRPAIVAENFQSYAAVKEQPAGKTTTFFDSKDGAITIISASSSGGLARKIVNDHRFNPAMIVHLLYLGEKAKNSNIAVNLAADKRLNPNGYSSEKIVYDKANCDFCRAGSLAIPLLGDQFDIRGPQPDPLVILKTHAPSHLDGTIDDLVGQEVLTVRGQGPVFSIDSMELLKSTAYLKRLKFFARRFLPAGVSHCFVDTDNSEEFAKIIAATTGQSFPIHHRNEIGTVGIDPETQAAPILIVVDVIASGRVMLEISRDLRNVAPDAPLIYLAGFSRMPSKQAKDALRKNLVQTHNVAQHAFETVEDLFVPGPELNNAWDSERQFLQKTRPSWDDTAKTELEPRLKRLRQTGKPFTNDLFLTINTPLQIQSGFAFWSKKRPQATQADVFFTVASVVQSIRTLPPGAKGNGLKNNWLQQTLVAPENFGRYNDGVIQAALLRACSSAELQYSTDPSLSLEMTRLIKRVLAAAHQPRGEAASEFLVALATRRLTLTDDHLEEVLHTNVSSPPLVQVLTALARKKLLP
ncbi:hypothetical protein BH09PSE3_BH09PSE3_17410 [soil metagenome]